MNIFDRLGTLLVIVVIWEAVVIWELTTRPHLYVQRTMTNQFEDVARSAGKGAIYTTLGYT